MDNTHRLGSDKPGGAIPPSISSKVEGNKVEVTITGKYKGFCLIVKQDVNGIYGQLLNGSKKKINQVLWEGKG